MVRESYYPGWKAFLNNKEIKIFRANGLFIGLEVPGGEQLLHLKFDPGIQKIGNLISALTFLFLLFYLFFRLVNRRKSLLKL